ncbi:hypothetical protein NDU88_000919 [Pleurodeles waltl]|uniref:Uncharacterized protein n=1 Tax=Pleurodeles waltl TaxID=8319 RepID=A0AAV7KRC0_PLEWA|nr:hypothetical protein NDU88_000919 [Pleurodeles waltl]
MVPVLGAPPFTAVVERQAGASAHVVLLPPEAPTYLVIVSGEVWWASLWPSAWDDLRRRWRSLTRNSLRSHLMGEKEERPGRPVDDLPLEEEASASSVKAMFLYLKHSLFAVFPTFGSKFAVSGDEFPIRGSVGDPERDCRLTGFEFLV